MELESYFFDTYAILGVAYGEPAYERFQKGSLITTKLNLMEMYYSILKESGKESAGEYYDRFNKFTVEIDDQTIKQAMEFRFLYKKRNMSYVDCIGYALAKKYRIPFLTGDKEFKDLPNVEYVK